MRRPWARALSAAAAALLALGAAASPAEEEQQLTYRVSVEDSNQVGGGSSPEQIVVACAAETCRIVAFPRLFGLEAAAPTFSVPGALRFSSDAIGGSCDALPAGPFEVDLAFTETGVSGTADKLEWRAACAGGGLISLAQSLSVEGELSSGECYFSAAGCGAAAPSPLPTAGAAGDDSAEDERDDATVTAATDDADASGTDEGTSSRLASGDPAAPSVLSALPPPAEAGIAPQQLALAALVTIILVLLMTFPTSLLNSAIDGAGERFAAWRERRGGRASAAPAWQGSWWWAAIGVLAAALISAFVDPQFGANPGSLRMLLSIAVAFAVDVALGWVVLLWVMRRLSPGATRSFSFKPLSLLVVVGAVIFTRVTGFEPGIVFGLVAGLGFAAAVGVAEKARTTLVPLIYAFVLAILSWMVYGAVADASGDSVPMTLLAETLSSLTVGGIVALPLALIPVKGLGGHSVWRASRRLWALAYGVGLLAFFIVLMPMPFSWAEVGWELWAWVGVYVAYAAVAVTAWAIVKRPWRREPAPADRTASEISAIPAAAVPAMETSAPNPVPRTEETP